MTDKLQTSTPGAAGFNPARIRLIQDRLKSWVEEGRTPAISALVARRGQVVLHEAYGRQTPDSPDGSLKANSIFPVMSAAKPVVAATAMMLVEEGLLSLTRRVRDYIPEIETEGADEILVHHLLTHSAGYNEFELAEWVRQHPVQELPEREDNQDRFTHASLHARYKAPLSFRPGTQNSYGSHCITLLSEIIRRVTGRHFSELAEERILTPLGMHDSAYTVKKHMADRLVLRGEGVAFDSSNEFITIDKTFDLPFASGGMLSTTWDMAIFAQTFMNGGIYDGHRILTSHTVSEMMRNQTPGIPAEGWGGRMIPESSWGLGWMVQGQEKWPYWGGSLQPLGTVYHQGIGASFVWMDLKHEIIGVYLTIVTEFDMETTAQDWDLDLFQNMVTSAVAD
jgi:CubicO group peptidase (beta-lactamase class C family)